MHSTNCWEKIDAVCFDVDSTVCLDEGLDELAAFCHVGDEVKAMTLAAMGGGMGFREAFKKRLDIVQPSKSRIGEFVAHHPPKLTPGIKNLVHSLKESRVAVYLVSGGLRAIIEPVADLLHIPRDHIFANRILFDGQGNYAGFDETEPTSSSGGKALVVDTLKQSPFGHSGVIMIGDGMTDLEAAPPADVFLGFGGNIVRSAVRDKAQHFFMEMQALQDFLVAKGVINAVPTVLSVINGPNQLLAR